VDLHLLEDAPTQEERAAVDELLGEPETGWEGGTRDAALEMRVVRSGRDAREQRHLLLPALHALQSRVGWISRGGMNYVSRRLMVPPAEAYGVATFYAMFSLEPRPDRVLHICDDLACRIDGARELCDALEASGAPGVLRDGDDGSEDSWTWFRSPCLGHCDEPYVVLVQRAGAGPDDFDYVAVGTDQTIVESVGALAGGEEGAKAGWSGITYNGRSGSVTPQINKEHPDRESLRLLRRLGRVTPASIDDYRAHGGFEALRRAIELGPDGTIAEVKSSKLLGRGGAAFPTGVKWEAVAQQPVRPHYFICNADESEPGTFKDRILMEEDPFALIEALTIAGFATGSELGYVYVRGEYPLAHDRLRHAIDECRRHDLLGADVMGHGFAFDVELRRGAGAYICGEETALFNSIEGKRGEPRNKPPFPVQRGLFGKPTGINNVETLLNVLEIMRIGGDAYAQLGTEGSTGPRLFCLSGSVVNPGLYEVEHGATVRDVVELAGGVRGELKALLLGGAAGSFVGPDALDLRLTFEDAKAGGYTLGSGVVMVFDDAVDLVDVVLRISRFFRDESCGQCVPCRVGTVRQEEALHRLVAGRTLGSREDEMGLLGEIAEVMRDASICGLGQTAANAVQSAISTLGVFAEGASSGGGEVPTPTEEQES
jgi:NADH-quinone oxidoreductase subunit F